MVAYTVLQMPSQNLLVMAHAAKSTLSGGPSILASAMEGGWAKEEKKKKKKKDKKTKEEKKREKKNHLH